jgi:hypothetical protein
MTTEEKQVPTTKRVRAITALQAKRINALIAQLRKREKVPAYIDGVFETDESVLFHPLKLGQPKAKDCSIVRAKDKTSIRQSRKASAWPTEEKAVLAEHSGIDLFMALCKRYPLFEKASVRRFQSTQIKASTKRPVPPIPYSGEEPPYVFGESTLFDRSEIHPRDLLNSMAFGTIGSGKTASFIEPLLFSMLDYRLTCGKTASILVIDPKIELLDGVKNKLRSLNELDRLVVVGMAAPFKYFSDDDALSVSDRFSKVKGFFPSSTSHGSDERWQQMSEGLILSMLRDDQVFSDFTGMPLLESICATVTDNEDYLLSGQWAAMRRLLLLGMEDMETLKHISAVYDAFLIGVGMPDPERPLARYVALKESEQFFYNGRGALLLASPLGSPEIASFLDLSVRRGLTTCERTDIAELVATGKVILFQPRPSATFELVGRALKGLFFRAVMEREDMERPMAYVVDEFQRFISNDSETGEHAMLDRNRAYRMNAVLASQSYAALATAVSGDRHSGSALDSIMTNCPSKVLFRTPDVSSVHAMQAVIPRDPYGDGHVLTFRHPSSLLVGEYYYTLQGKWGRTRYNLPSR